MLNKQIKIINSDLEDAKSDVISVMGRNLGPKSADWFDWKYKNNVFGQAKCWLVKEGNEKKAIGIAVLFPRIMYSFGTDVLSAVSGDIALDKEYRGLGPALELMKTIMRSAESSGIRFIYSLPNSASRRLALRAGYTEIGRLERFVKVLRVDYKLSRILKSSFLRVSVASIVDLFLWFLSREVWLFASKGIRTQVINEFDAGFDKLWDCAKNSFKVIGKRSSQVLNWRYRFSEDGYQFFSMSNSNGDALGYVVFKNQGQIFYVMDILAKDMGKMLDVLLARFINFARRKRANAVSLTYFGNRVIKKKLRSFGFLERGDPPKSFLLYCKDKTMSIILGNQENWYFFMGDNDV